MKYYLFSDFFRVKRLALIAVTLIAVLAIPMVGHGSVDIEYDKYKVELRRLEEDASKSQYRHYWLNLAERFNRLYVSNPTWPNRAAALFRAAEAYDALAQRSYTNTDRQMAIDFYEKVYKEFPNSVLADDALYNMARVYNEQTKNSARATEYLKLLIDKYPNADHAPKAKEYAKNMELSLTASLSNNLESLKAPAEPMGRAVYQGVRAIERGDIIQLRVAVDASKRKNNLVTWSLDYSAPQAATNSPARLILTLSDTTAQADTKAGHKYVNMGILSRYVIDYSKRNSTTVIIDFTELAAYYAYFDKASSSIIIETTSKSNRLSKGVITKSIANKEVQANDLSTRAFAMKMGIDIKTIIIDAGHGGKDPGAVHNGMLEKDIALEVALLLGDKLEKMGYNIEYTRKNDTFLSLSQRAAIAEDRKGDLFISVHANGAENPRISGIETYYLDYTKDPGYDHLGHRETSASTSRSMSNLDSAMSELAFRTLRFESERLASFVQTNMYGFVNRRGFEVQNGGTKGSVFSVLENTFMPGVLLEVGYMSNTYDARNLKNKAYLNSIADGIAKGINSYADELNLARNGK